MSDGPYKSLPLPAHWKAVARRAERAAYSDQEVGELFARALAREFRSVPVERVRAIMGGDGQGVLFPKERIEQLEALRRNCEASAASHSFINCAIEQVHTGQGGTEACGEALKNAKDEYCRALIRSAAEHYHRKGDAAQAEFVRGRLDEARRSGQPASGGGGKKTGIDDKGPKL